MYLDDLSLYLGSRKVDRQIRASHLISLIIFLALTTMLPVEADRKMALSFGAAASCILVIKYSTFRYHNAYRNRRK